jgi:hypothetical protein
MVHRNCEITFRSVKNFIKRQTINLMSDFITSCYVLPDLNFFAGNSTKDIQNLKIRSRGSINNDENQVFCFHERLIIDILVKQDSSSNRVYMISLDESRVCGIWDTNRAKLGPLFVLNFGHK